ncbi:hypothetical protein INT47_002397 [Mucor saturninus]|uniref:C2H2-type domain-containing protein n=1 Tax=Mucor saturninus TaxID=64648 RepID=A0A8H7V7U6_9FUNG|nr:hypothetical protein INT47_002397 [Mucor saturninus]
MTYSNLNMNDINDILFPQNDIINHNKNSKADEFNFTQVWGEIDGEYNQVSEFVEACKLIVSMNALAASIALNEQNISSSSSIEDNSLAAFIGDITPAAAAVAVAAAAVGESPMMDTPFLDSCMGTPFTPASVFTPSLAQFHHSPYYSPYMDNSFNITDCMQGDIQVSSYIKSSNLSWQTPAAVTADLFANTISSTDVSPELLNSLDTFNGDPTQLLLASMDNNNNDNNISNNNNNNNTITDDSEDPLFPPLSTDQLTYEPTMVHTDTNHELFTTEDFEANNFLNDCFDDTFFPMQPQEQAMPEPVQEIKPVVTKTNNKRKNDGDCSKMNKRFKATNNEEQRKFECDICHAVFNRRYNLGTHIKVHSPTRVKDFDCHLCKKAFDRKHDLTRHVATVHNGERAYSCTQCTSTFSRKDALVRHQVQKHQPKP